MVNQIINYCKTIWNKLRSKDTQPDPHEYILLCEEPQGELMDKQTELLQEVTNKVMKEVVDDVLQEDYESLRELILFGGGLALMPAEALHIIKEEFTKDEEIKGAKDGNN